MTQPGKPAWLATPALGTAVGSCALLLLLAVILRRQDLLVIALPMVVGTVLPLLSRAYRPPSIRAEVATTTLLEGESTVLTEQIQAAEPIDVIHRRVVLEGQLSLAEGGIDLCTSVRPGETGTVSHQLSSPRWGRGRVDRFLINATTAHGLLRANLECPGQVSVQTVPLREGFRATERVPNAAGVVGGHRSRRTGEGVDFAGVRAFAPGDRLHRINWPVSTRTGQLHVSATYSDRDTEVVLVLDTSAEVSDRAGASTTIDLAVRAAASIAEHYLRNGDRVGMLDLSRAGRPIRSRTGRSQLNRLVEILLDVRTAPASEQSIGRALSRISNRALVIVLSPLLSDELAATVAGLARTGRSVVVVDTLPADVLLPEPGEWTELAWRLQLLHRTNLVGALAQHGVPVVPWLGSGSLDQVLIGLSRIAVAPRAIR
ncbi:MAG: DUF58 domain-containing protein [Jatrophihabitantaceae bacterium]